MHRLLAFVRDFIVDFAGDVTWSHMLILGMVAAGLAVGVGGADVFIRPSWSHPRRSPRPWWGDPAAAFCEIRSRAPLPSPPSPRAMIAAWATSSSGRRPPMTSID